MKAMKQEAKHVDVDISLQPNIDVIDNQFIMSVISCNVILMLQSDEMIQCDEQDG